MHDRAYWNYVNDFMVGEMNREQFWSFAVIKLNKNNKQEVVGVVAAASCFLMVIYVISRSQAD